MLVIGPGMKVSWSKSAVKMSLIHMTTTLDRFVRILPSFLPHQSRNSQLPTAQLLYTAVAT